MIAVTPAEPGHAGAIAELLEEMGRFYGSAAAEEHQAVMRQINEALFTSPPDAHALVAFDGSRIVGLAAYSFLWPAVGPTTSLYLKELYVAKAYRGTGAGKLLMGAVFDAAANHRCTRVEWTTDSGNTGARAFYARLGARPLGSKLFYRVEGSATQPRTGQ